jgi:glycosyltransferase involved in cell wall biosynthesis
MMPSISVVTPNFNMGSYLAETIESVLCNLGPNDEYFIIDGGSHDNSVEIIRHYAKHLSGWVSEPDRGYADAIAKGFSRARGDVLCWINSGDLYLNGAFNEARSEIIRTGADLIFGDDFYIDEQSKVIQFSRGYISTLRDAMLYGGWTPLQDACFWKRSLYERINGINPCVSVAADYDLFLRLSTNGSTCYVPYAFSAFRRHHSQKSQAHSVTYALERATCRNTQLLQIGDKGVKELTLSLIHKFRVRLRIHLQQRLWRRPDLHGKDIGSLGCACYWPLKCHRAYE